MKIKLKQINPMSLGKVFAVIYAGIGVLYGLMIFLASLAGGVMATAMDSSGAAFGPVMGLVMMLVMPILLGIAGFIGGLIAALIYNLAFKITGGLELGVAPVAGSEKEFEAFTNPV